MVRKDRRRHSTFSALIISLVLVAALFIPVVLMEDVTKNVDAGGSGDPIFYVGGSGAGNYTKIQDAIDNASSGDTA